MTGGAGLSKLRVRKFKQSEVLWRWRKFSAKYCGFQECLYLCRVMDYDKLLETRYRYLTLRMPVFFFNMELQPRRCTTATLRNDSFTSKSIIHEKANRISDCQGDYESRGPETGQGESIHTHSLWQERDGSVASERA